MWAVPHEGGAFRERIHGGCVHQAVKRVVVIGSGFAGLAAACCLAHDGFSVTVLEKNDQLGGRARVWEKDGFTFDLGPSWYWMPDVFEQFFARFGKRTSDYYTLTRLDPSYRVFLAGEDRLDVPAGRAALEALFDAREPGSAARLRAFLEQAEYSYRVGMSDFVRRPSLRAREFADPRLLREALRLQLFASMHSRVATVVKDDGLRQVLEFPALFLGGTARQIPAILTEIGRLRELTFRLSGEGTGLSKDLDTFDADYEHIFIWNSTKCHVVGSYRMCRTEARRWLTTT